MILTAKQEEGLKIAVKRYNNHEAYTCISGYAGTGKSTLVRFIIDALDLPPAAVTYVAYTGKAAQVLRQKGCPNAITAHRLLYHTYVNKRGELVFYPRKHGEIGPYQLIIVDEVSMLPKTMWELLLSHDIHVIALGDPFQLPPVKESKEEHHEILEHPHVFLEEIMRQAEDNEIIRLTMGIREQKPLDLFQGENVRIVDPSELSQPGLFGWPDQILVAKNATRHDYNDHIRATLFERESRVPQIGDKIICLQNEWNRINDTDDALVNGMTGFIEDIELIPRNVAVYTEQEYTPRISFKPDIEDSGVFTNLLCDYKLFTEKTPMLDRYTMSRKYKECAPSQFDYGYVITCHKSQGSEFDKVLVLEEYLRGATKEDHARWLYTAATRASKKLIIVRDYRHVPMTVFKS